MVLKSRDWERSTVSGVMMFIVLSVYILYGDDGDEMLVPAKQMKL